MQKPNRMECSFRSLQPQAMEVHVADVENKSRICANTPHCNIPVEPGYVKCTRCEASERGTLHILVIREREAKKKPRQQGW